MLLIGRKTGAGRFFYLIFLPLFSCQILSGVDFSRDIRPVLSGKCFKCHGPDTEARKAKLRLDQRNDALEVIVPGSPDESDFFDRITTSDPVDRMPPKGPPLTPAQIAAFRAWIKEGANYERHWAYVKPEVAELPHQANPIDYFVQRRLDEKDLSPSPQAEPAVLLRRLYLDLIGLPPSVEEVEAFENNPQDFEAVVDRLLKSSHFGEKWAAGWLDLARYADSNGYQHDDLRTMWPYRDWVVNALNADMPFDQFTIEQLAGDLLPKPTTDQLVATGFNRNVPANFSGGTKVSELRANILHDRVATTGAVWLGLTLECAQCHDHKFDAVSQREYYQLYAYFNQAIPEVKQESPTKFRKLFIGREVVVYQSEADRFKATELRRGLSAEEAQLGPEEKDTGEATILDFEGPNSVAANNTSHPASTSAVNDTPDDGGKRAAKTVIKPAIGNAGYFGTSFRFPVQNFSGFSAITFWVKTDIKGYWSFQVHNAGRNVSVYTFSTLPVKPGTWTQITAPLKEFKKPSWSPGAVDFEKVTKIQITAYQSGPYAGKYMMLDNVIGQRNSERDLRLKRIAKIREELTNLETSTMVMQDAEQPPASHIMIRGDYTTPGDPVETGALSALHPLNPSFPRNRLGLAKWLMAPENPLTARVTVNRFWAEVFGQGIVTTPEDFGMQSASPSHPKLLDWLALEFVRNNWSVKQLLKTIVMSATYRQTAAVPSVKIGEDPKNTWLARGPRFRLSAELIRDNLLAISGKLSPKVGGPSVYPVQPDGLWEEISGADVTDYPTSTDEDRFRRGLYTFLRRGNPNPMILNFDGSDRSACITKRDRSNTPVQALNLLNDPVFVEMATAFGERIWAWKGNDREKAVRAFRTAVARQPSDKEVAILLDLRRKHGSWFAVAQALMNLDETITK
ncbi:MAG: hypothetical protein CMO80_05655 [Verrucomicrobiales bacterium]|nr:hypothetical protein [Verrucomicrobiales bacterium]